VALRPIDLAVVIAYLLGITWFGVHFRKSQRTLSDYFLGGRQLPWWALALSVVSAETSILTIISTPGIAYRSNFGFLQLVLGYLVARVVVSFVLIPRYFAGDLFTAYQFVERRFGRGLKLFTAALFLSTRALAEGVRVFAMSVMVQVMFHNGVLTAALHLRGRTQSRHLDRCDSAHHLHLRHRGRALRRPPRDSGRLGARPRRRGGKR